MIFIGSLRLKWADGNIYEVFWEAFANMADIKINIVRSKRKNLTVMVSLFGDVMVKAPLAASKNDIDEFIDKHSDWIVEKVRENIKNQRQPVLTEDETEKLMQSAAVDFKKRVERLAVEMNVTYGRITIRGQKSKFGSCSERGNLNFNFILMLAPEEVREYIVIHELTHRKHMNHSGMFWHDVEKIMPDYKIWDDWLKKYGGILIERIPRGGDTNENHSYSRYTS